MLNIETLKQNLECDDEFLAHLIDTFKTESTEIIERLEGAIDEGDYTAIRGLSHKMLSSTRILNLSELTQSLKNIELKAEAKGSINEIKEEFERSQDLFNDIVEDLKTKGL